MITPLRTKDADGDKIKYEEVLYQHPKNKNCEIASFIPSAALLRVPESADSEFIYITPKVTKSLSLPIQYILPIVSPTSIITINNDNPNEISSKNHLSILDNHSWTTSRINLAVDSMLVDPKYNFLITADSSTGVIYILSLPSGQIIFQYKQT